ncbi:EndoU domain-containing protein [Nonlabens spongiae]|uniref:EndoU domain-containing protein n=1 Tax=Nonlabens spongiae TaxID=331648 RepID=UPI00146DBDAF|nr:EndoU domain-containing protein [Nonlabens spongiae]
MTRIDIPPTARVNELGEIVNLPNDLPFKGKVKIRYRDGWLPKQDNSSLFPQNWTQERILGEVAMAYERNVLDKSGLLPPKPNQLFDKYEVDSSFESWSMILEVKDDIIFNAYPKL